MTTLWIDLETYSPRGGPKDLGTYEYARTSEILLVAYALDDGPARVWDRASAPARSAPHELLDALNDPAIEIVAHNAQFDRAVLDAGDQRTDPGRWRCTMAQALAHGFPGSLDQIGRILGLPEDQAKLGEGKALINRFCGPAPSNHKADRYDHESHPEEWARFVEYARRDIDAMRVIADRLPPWNYEGEELDLWRLDQKINDRGFAVDRELVDAGAAAAETEKAALRARFRQLTGGAVSSPTQREQLRLYLNETYGLELEDTRANTLRLVAKGDWPADLLEIIDLSIAANKTSTAKYKALQPAISPDGRFRGGLQFAGAARTRRWSGRKFQPHNLPSRGLPPSAAVESYIDALKAGCHDLLFDNLMLYGSAALRGVVVAPEGRKLIAADLSNIEGRMNAWLAGERWKLKAFEAFDRGEGPDLYNVTAGLLLGKAPDAIGKTERNVMGKVPELALGYAGGVGAFQTFARAYGVRMVEHRETIEASLGEQAIAQARENWTVWGKARNAGAVAEDEWLVSETVKLAWRDRHPAICRLWKACEEAAVQALEHRGRTFFAGEHLAFKAVIWRGWQYLLMRLPSGRFLVYFDPKLGDQARAEMEDEDAEDDVLSDSTLTYMGLHPLTKKWARLTTYGGKLVENACQSLARDVLAASMPVAEAAGFDVILTVHDEIVTEAAPDRTVEDLARIMSVNPPWSDGLPLAAAGFEAQRYRKE